MGAGEGFAAFLPEFEQVLSEDGEARWADQVTIAFLEGTLGR